MGNGGGYPPLNTDDFRDSGFWTLPYPEGHKRRSQLEVGTQRACRRLAFNNYFWDAEMHRRWRVVASSSGANFLPRNFDEIFEPLSFAIPKSPTTTQARPSSGQSKFSSSQQGEKRLIKLFLWNIFYILKRSQEKQEQENLCELSVCQNCAVRIETYEGGQWSKLTKDKAK